MKSYPHGNDYMRGTWKGLSLEGGGRSASFTCPECGRTAVLTDHEIDGAGVVSPSVVCPYGDCTFHEYIRLEGFGYGEAQAG